MKHNAEETFEVTVAPEYGFGVPGGEEGPGSSAPELRSCTTLCRSWRLRRCAFA